MRSAIDLASLFSYDTLGPASLSWQCWGGVILFFDGAGNPELFSGYNTTGSIGRLGVGRYFVDFLDWDAPTDASGLVRPILVFPRAQSAQAIVMTTEDPGPGLRTKRVIFRSWHGPSGDPYELTGTFVEEIHALVFVRRSRVSTMKRTIQGLLYPMDVKNGWNGRDIIQV